MKLRHILIIGSFILINGLIIFSLKSGMSEEEEVKAKKEYISTLGAIKVINSEEEFQTMGYGNVSSYNSIDISSEVQGKLSKGKVDLKPGIKFSKGDLLFKVYDVEARYSVRARKSSFITLIANILPDINTDFNPEYNKWNAYIESIKLNEVLPQLPVWTSDKEKIFLSTKNILSEYFSIKAQEEQLKKYYIYAPFSGSITDVYVNDYSVVNPGVKVMRIVQTSNYEIAVSVPVDEIDNVKMGTKANIFTTSDQLKGSGTVVRISEVLNKNTQSVNVYVKAIELKDKKFIDGEYVKVELNVEGKHEGIRISSKAISDNNVYIYAKEDSMLYLKPIVILNENLNGVFVSGLNDNDILITQEVINHQDSTKYNVILK
tara:strand:- start:1160 stop:2284 length:1125 start_codon:yes stop_codon:yes gene_type:complete